MHQSLIQYEQLWRLYLAKPAPLIHRNHTKMVNKKLFPQSLGYYSGVTAERKRKIERKQRRKRATPLRVKQLFSASSIWRLLELLSGWRGVMNNVCVCVVWQMGERGISWDRGGGNENERQPSHPDSRSTPLRLRLQPSGSQRRLGFLIILFSCERKWGTRVIPAMWHLELNLHFELGWKLFSFNSWIMF